MPGYGPTSTPPGKVATEHRKVTARVRTEVARQVLCRPAIVPRPTEVQALPHVGAQPLIVEQVPRESPPTTGNGGPDRYWEPIGDEHPQC